MANTNQVKPGDPLRFPAATYNELMRMLIWWRAQNPAANKPLAPVRELDVIKLKNTSGDDLAAFSVLGLDDPIVEPDDNENEFKFRFAMKGVTPTRATHYRKFAVLLEPAADGAIVPAAVDGLVVARVNVTDAAHTHADVIDDETILESGVCGGALIEWKETGTGEKWAIVQLGAPTRTAIAKAGSAIDAASSATPGTGTVTEWTFDGEDLVESGLDFDGYNTGDTEAPADKFLQLMEVGGKMVIGGLGGGGGGPRHYLATLDASLAATDSTKAITLTTALDGEAMPADVTVTGQNPIHWAGPSGAVCLVTENLDAEPTEYIIAVIQHYDCEA